MIQVRKGVFETNSSSTHSICIFKGEPKFSKYVEFHLGEWGWETSIETDTASYLYTAIICCFDKEDSDIYLEHLKQYLEHNNIEYSMEDPVWKVSGDEMYSSSGYIDHGGELREFVEAVLDDWELLSRYLFGDSFIATGNDNGCYGMCEAAFETVYDRDRREHVANPYHDGEHYDYFYKGN